MAYFLYEKESFNDRLKSVFRTAATILTRYSASLTVAAVSAAILIPLTAKIAHDTKRTGQAFNAVERKVVAKIQAIPIHTGRDAGKVFFECSDRHCVRMTIAPPERQSDATCLTIYVERGGDVIRNENRDLDFLIRYTRNNPGDERIRKDCVPA